MPNKMQTIERLIARGVEIAGIAGELVVDCRESKLTPSDIKELGGIADTVWLSLAGLKVRDNEIFELRTLVNLEFLSLSDTSATGHALRVLSYMPSIHVLHIAGICNLSRGVRYISSCGKLEAVDLERSDADSHALATLVSMPTIKSIDVTDTRISEDDILRLNDEAVDPFRLITVRFGQGNTLTICRPVQDSPQKGI
jgi:hypothetical protein